MYIYGASYIGTVTGKALLAKGFKIKGYIDKRADEIKSCLGISVYSLDEMEEKQDIDAVIFVAVKNVYYHTEIASELMKRGYTKIIYKTIHAINGEMSDDEKLLDRAYECIYKVGNVPNYEIPIISPKQIFSWKDISILEETESTVTINVPLEQIYTGVTAPQWSDVPVLSLIPYIRLFQYFDGDTTKCIDDYIELCEEGARSENVKITEGWRQYVLDNRMNIFEQMRWKYDHYPIFFVQQAPRARWNKKGYFNLCTGKHRVCFLIAMGKTSIPIKIEKQEWIELITDSKLQEIKVLLQDNPTYKVPLPHFYFQGNIQYYNRQCQKILRTIYEDLYDSRQLRGQERSHDSVKIESPYAGYFALIFSQMGFNVIDSLEIPDIDRSIYEKLGMKNISSVADRDYMYLGETV